MLRFLSDCWEYFSGAFVKQRNSDGVTFSLSLKKSCRNGLLFNELKMRRTKNKILHLPILVEQDEDDVYIVSCPVFKGCHSYGKTIDEALVNIREVIDMCIDEEKEKITGINRFVGFREMQVSLKAATV